MSSHVGNIAEEMSSSDAGERPFRMLTIFDSAESNAEAASALRLVLEELGDEVPVNRTAWDVRLLDSPILRGRAAEQAACADLIVLALSSKVSNDSVRDWINQWQANRSVDGGLLAFIPTDSSDSSADFAEFVSEAAVSANMDFLCKQFPRF